MRHCRQSRRWIAIGRLLCALAAVERPSDETATVLAINGLEVQPVLTEHGHSAYANIAQHRLTFTPSPLSIKRCFQPRFKYQASYHCRNLLLPVKFSVHPRTVPSETYQWSAKTDARGYSAIATSSLSDDLRATPNV